LGGRVFPEAVAGVLVVVRCTPDFAWLSLLSFCRWSPSPHSRFYVCVRLKTSLNTDPLVPNSETNTWPIGASWKKYLIRLSAERGWGMIFPQLPNNRSMSTNHLEPGTNDKLSGAAAAAARAKFTVPLLSTKDVLEGTAAAKYDMKSLMPPAFESLTVFNLHRQQLESVDSE
jgi:hypothetical protein